MKIKTVDLVLIALFAAVTAVMSQLSIPTPFGVPVSLQTFAVALCGYFLGAKKGTSAMIVYILVGAVGVPVFAGFKGGLAALLGVTGGFIFGFIPLALLCGIEYGRLRMPARTALRLLTGAGGILVCHIFGAAQYALLMGIDLVQSFLTVSVPFLIKDFASLAAAYLGATAAKAAVRKFTVGNR